MCDSPGKTGLRHKAVGFFYLTRMHRPVGILLLLWPTITALWLAAGGLPPLDLLLIFVAGTVVMRAAGCCVNDFADYHIDGKVLRTRERPLATGMLSRRDAMGGFAFLSLIGFALVLRTNAPTIGLAVAAVPIIAVYPFLKRVTQLPQLALGVAFSWGILMAFTAVGGGLPAQAWLLFLANLLWTVVYDTQYAMVDREYDRQIGVKSTAILFGKADNLVIGILQFGHIALMWVAGLVFGLGHWYFALLAGAGILFAWQQYLCRSRSPTGCFRAFRNNGKVGGLVWLGVVIGLTG